MLLLKLICDRCGNAWELSNDINKDAETLLDKLRLIAVKDGWTQEDSSDLCPRCQGQEQGEAWPGNKCLICEVSYRTPELKGGICPACRAEAFKPAKEG